MKISKWVKVGLLGLILLAAAVLRLTGLDWDDYNHYHPDERFITLVATSIEWPQDWSEAFIPHKSTINPFYWPAGAESEGLLLDQDQPRRFAYGHFPLYLGVAFTRLTERIGPVLGPLLPQEWLLTQDVLNVAGWIEFRHLTAVTRLLTALIDVVSVAVTFLVGRRLFGTDVGLLSAAFLALNVMHIQLAHFFTTDPYLTLFVLLTILFLLMVVLSKDGGRRRAIYLGIAAVFAGLSVGSKFSAIMIVLPMVVAVWLGWPQRRWLVRVGLLAAAGLVMLLSFAVTNPFALLDNSCATISPAVNLGPVHIPALRWESCYLENVTLQATMVQGLRDVPFVRQYIGTKPYLYDIEMQLRWGMGLLLGLAAFGGFVLAVGRFLRHYLPFKWDFLEKPAFRGQLVVLAWAIPFFVTTGGLDVKFMRYLEPLVPFLMIYGAAMLLSWRRTLWRNAAVILVLLFTGWYALAFVNIYRQEHPWVTASRWIYENVSPGQMIVNEVWDDPLPDALQIGDTIQRRSQYRTGDVNWLSGIGSLDNEDKLLDNLSVLATADYVVLSSNRNYGVIPRLEQMYPLSSQYYPMLFDGRLGFEVAYVGSRFPNLFNFHLKPDTFGWPGLQPPEAVTEYLDSIPGISGGRVDESFTVYDQPLVIIFRNVGQMTAEEMAELFE
ncbi:MAG: glycosyltransferase family 39 protein [Candidatus Promineifilaceae bacterium]